LTLPIAALTAPHIDWEQDPGLEPAYNPMLGKIRILAESGLTSMMMLHDYVLKRIAPLQEHTRPTWLYTGVNEALVLVMGKLSEEALVLVMGKLSPDPSSHDFITPPASCQPLCMDQAARSMLLVAMPSMDDAGFALIQGGDQSRGVRGRWAARAALSPVRPPARVRRKW
jgi:hypothetical protein